MEIENPRARNAKHKTTRQFLHQILAITSSMVPKQQLDLQKKERNVQKPTW